MYDKPKADPAVVAALAAAPAPDLDDPENPEWTQADFVRARGPESLPPEVLAAFRHTRVRGPQKRPTKRQQTLRLDPDVLDYFKAARPRLAEPHQRGAARSHGACPIDCPRVHALPPPMGRDRPRSGQGGACMMEAHGAPPSPNGEGTARQSRQGGACVMKPERYRSVNSPTPIAARSTLPIKGREERAPKPQAHHPHIQPIPPRQPQRPGHGPIDPARPHCQTPRRPPA